MKFNPCIGECTETGTHCKGCGRSHEEIAETRQLIKGLVTFIQKMEYENPENFTRAVTKKVLSKLNEE